MIAAAKAAEEKAANRSGAEAAEKGGLRTKLMEEAGKAREVDGEGFGACSRSGNGQGFGLLQVIPSRRRGGR